jgi:hypothetical protein
MKKLIASIALITCASANVNAHSIGGHNVWPLVIGGTIGYVIANQQRPVIMQQAPVIVQSPVYNNSFPVYNLPRAPHQGATPLYERRSQWDPNCNCYVVVYNQIGWQ